MLEINFLNNNENKITTSTSAINNTLHMSLIIILTKSPDEYVYHDTIAVPSNPKNIQKRMSVKLVLNLYSLPYFSPFFI